MNLGCIKCKGRRFCGRKFCAHLLKSNSMFKVKKNLADDFSSSAPAPFVGHVGYPVVNIGILTPPEKIGDAWRYDAPKFWAEQDYSIPEIVDFRSSLINSRTQTRVKGNSRFLEISQEVGMASSPVDVDIKLDEKPRFRLSTSPQMAPMGPKGDLQKAQITSNPKIDRKVDRVVSDTDLKAADALNYLYENNFDENFLTRVFTVGNLGMKKDRRLVPTRWSITAVDDTLGKNLHKQIVHNNDIDEFLVYFGSYLGNYYILLLMSNVWSYELFETYMPKASWNKTDAIDFTTDHEGFKGRIYYADNCAGGYYTVRLALLEKLKKMKRQASCVAFRIITGDYSVPLGVWVTREAARKVLAEKPIKFSSLDLATKYISILCNKKFGFDIGVMANKSKILAEQKTQKKLNQF